MNRNYKQLYNRSQIDCRGENEEYPCETYQQCISLLKWTLVSNSGKNETMRSHNGLAYYT